MIVRVFTGVENPDSRNGASIRAETIVNLFKQRGVTVRHSNFLPRRAWRARRFSYIRALDSLDGRMGQAPGTDVLFLVGLELSHGVDSLPSTLKVIDVCDSILELWMNRIQRLDFRAFLALPGLIGLVLKARRADAITYISEEDLRKDRFLWKNIPCYVVANEPDVALVQIEPLDRSRMVIGYLADLLYRPNIEGLEWFLETVWPHIVSQGWALHIFGPHETPFNLPSGVSYLGFQPSLVDVYASIDVAIAPDFAGAGYKNKVGEALLASRPVVCTTRAARGQSENPGLLIANDSKEVIEVFKKLCDSRFLINVSREMAMVRNKDAVFLQESRQVGAFKSFVEEKTQ